MVDRAKEAIEMKNDRQNESAGKIWQSNERFDCPVENYLRSHKLMFWGRQIFRGYLFSGGMHFVSVRYSVACVKFKTPVIFFSVYGPKFTKSGGHARE